MNDTLSPAPKTSPRPARRRLGLRGLLAGLSALLLALPVHAEVDPDAAQDPPARVGRVSLLRGPADLSRERGAAWEPARANQPVTTETALWVPPGSQAELRIGSAAVRLDGNTQAVFSQLDDHGIAIDVAQGTVRARVRNLPTGDAFSLSAEGVRAEALQPGDYRVAYDPDLRAYTVRALAGRLRVVTPTNSVNLEAGQESLVERGGGTLQLRAIGPRDDFDRWAEARDREHDRLIASRYVSPETTGIEALDEHGRWEIDSGYGAIWYPAAVPYGWAPYRYGHWAWLAPWGWTWVDDSPWGFAPFHYGRWALVDHRWGWVPGPIVARPVWTPALVGWVGGQSGHLSWSIGFGAPIGWFPLAPYEVYYPPYRHSVVYVERINVWRERGPARYPARPYDPQRGDPRHAGDDGRPRDPQREGLPNYRYAQHRDALTVVREDTFRNARPVGREQIPLDAQQRAALRPVIGQTPELGGAAPDRGARHPGLPPRARVERLPAPPARARASDPQPRATERPAPERARPEEPRRPPAARAAPRAPDERADPPSRRSAPPPREPGPANPPPREWQRRGPSEGSAPAERLPERARPPQAEARDPRRDDAPRERVWPAVPAHPQPGFDAQAAQPGRVSRADAPARPDRAERPDRSERGDGGRFERQAQRPGER